MYIPPTLLPQNNQLNKYIKQQHSEKPKVIFSYFLMCLNLYELLWMTEIKAEAGLDGKFQ